MPQKIVQPGDYQVPTPSGPVCPFDLDERSFRQFVLTVMSHFGMLHNIADKFPEPSPLRDNQQGDSNMRGNERKLSLWINGANLTGEKQKGRWHFVCERWPDLALAHNGAATVDRAVAAFTARALAGTMQIKEVM